MARFRQVVLASAGVLLALVACGGESTKSNGANAASGASAAAGTASVPSIGGSGSTLAGAPTTPGGQAVGGSTSLGGSDGGATLGAGVSGVGGHDGEGGVPNCPAIKCDASCPGEHWLGLDGCSTCACAPPAPQLSLDAFSCPAQSLTLKATSSYYVGAIDRWQILFEWACSAVALGSPSRASYQLSLVQTPPLPLDATNHTFYSPSPSPQSFEPFEVGSATVWLRGSGVPEITMPLSSKNVFLSIRREGDELVGGVQYVGEDSTQAHQATLAGPFRVPVPTF